MSAMIGESVLARATRKRQAPRQPGENQTMSLIYFLIVGLIAGVIASYVMGRQQDLLSIF
jgi:hypothetical protein